MSHTPPKKFRLIPKLLTGIIFIALFSAYISVYATPPTTPYQIGETLDPTCAPGDANCFVQILPDQAGHAGQYLMTNGTLTGWGTVVSSQWLNNGPDIYFNTGKVGIGTSVPSGPFQAASLQYNTGTASQSGTTVTGIGTTWTAAMVGSEFTFANGIVEMITARNSNTSLTVDATNSVSLQSYSILYSGLTVQNSGNLLLGSITNPGQNSRMFVYGGNVGANIDARGTPGQFKDISQFEAEGNDYDTLPNSVAIRYFGSTAAGSQTLMGYDSNKLGVLDFLNNTASLIRSDAPIQFGGGPSDLVTMTLNPTTQRLGIGITTPGQKLDVSGNVQFSGALMPNSTAGTSGQVLTSAGAGAAPTWTTPSTIATLVPISGLTGATAGNDIENGDNAQIWRWTNLNSYGLQLFANSTNSGNTQALLDVERFGVNDTSDITTYAFNASNGHTGINATNVGGVFSSSGGTTNIGISATATGGTNNYAAIFAQGFVGVGQTSPTVRLHVGSTAITDGTTLLRLQDVNSVCDFNANTGAPTCGSDMTLKKDITSLDNADLFDRVTALNPVSYHWLTDESSANLQYGFIAQEVAAQFPDLVTDHTWIDGTTRKFLNMGGLVPYLAGAIKEMNLKVTGLDDFTKENTWRDSFIAWFSNAANHITRIFTGELCLTDTDGTSECINKTELHSLKQLLNTTQSSGGGGTTQDPAIDACPALDGDQATIPDGYHADETGACVLDEVAPADPVQPADPTDQNLPAETPAPVDSD